MKKNRSKSRSIWKYVVEGTAVVGCLGTIVFGWLAVKVGRDASQDARRIAIESGALDKPELQLLLGSQSLSPGQTTRVVLGSALTDKDIYIAYLPLVIRNQGKKTAKNVGVIDQFPKLARPGLAEL